MPRSVCLSTDRLKLSRISSMDATDTELATVLASALRGLVEYVDARTDDDTEDDDVRALEDVAAVLHQAPPEARMRLREMWGEEFAAEVGLE
jgi:hypothetical protein